MQSAELVLPVACLERAALPAAVCGRRVPAGVRGVRCVCDMCGVCCVRPQRAAPRTLRRRDRFLAAQPVRHLKGYTTQIETNYFAF